MIYSARAHWHRYLVRTIDPPPDSPPDDPPRDPPGNPTGGLRFHRLILARGPFGVEDEITLMQAERIDTLVTKNSGGAAGGGCSSAGE